MTFWDHLDELRKAVFRCLAVYLAASVLLFCFKEFLFNGIILPPTGRFGIRLVNIEITAQFMTHVKVAFITALIVCVPYFLLEIWHFVKPALYDGEKRTVRLAFGFASLLFYLGLAVGYFVVMPLMMRFFNGYSVSESIVNTFSLTSYISMLATTVLLFGLVFELPSLAAILSSLGLITRSTLLAGWRYAIIAVVVLAAVITPSGDPFSLFVVSLPLLLLYGISIAACRSSKNE